MQKIKNKYNFTDEQLIIYNELLNLTKLKYGDMILIEGYAGTGKTYLTTKFIHELIANNQKVISKFIN
jgi:KaiC/GvpD/RAD55 family RecA-like ATPase